MEQDINILKFSLARYYIKASAYLRFLKYYISSTLGNFVIITYIYLKAISFKKANMHQNTKNLHVQKIHKHYFSSPQVQTPD